MLRIRALLVVPVALLLAFASVRAMTFVAPASHSLRALEPYFPAHPDAMVKRAMVEIGSAARRGGAVPPSARQTIAAAARKAPLAPDPFLVEGVIADMAGDGRRAEPLFAAARQRDPRSEGARYFLADRYFKTNRILPGLVEMAALARLSEKAAQPLIPALAAYAQTPGAVDKLRRFFTLSPALGDRTLALLARDVRNAPLIFTLAPKGLDHAAPVEWHANLISSLIAAGDYSGAEALWKRLTGVADRGLLYNPQFRPTTAPPPFNWQFPIGAAGVAQPSDSGGLDVIYYGRDDVVLASQLLRLPPARYRLSMRIEGRSGGGGLSWTIVCLPANTPLASLPVGQGEGAIAGPIEIPAAGCPAQVLELRGRPGDSSGTAQLTITALQLNRLAATP